MYEFVHVNTKYNKASINFISIVIVSLFLYKIEICQQKLFFVL